MKRIGFVIDLGHKISPIVTPDKPDEFEAALRARTTLGTSGTPQMKGPFI